MEMSSFEGTPSDELDGVLACGDGDVDTLFLSLSARHPEGRDAEYLRWHSLDHRSEQHRLAGLRGALRLISTPACRAARAASDGALDATDHVMSYLFSDVSALGPFHSLGRALEAGGRRPIRLPSVATGAYQVAGKVAAARVVVGADVVPWRPASGAYLLLEDGEAPVDDLVDVDGVAGLWSATRCDGPPGTPWRRDPGARCGERAVVCFLDDDPVLVAARLRPVLQRRWAQGGATPSLAAPFHVVVAPDWDRFLP